MIEAIIKLSGSLFIGGLGLLFTIFALLLFSVLGTELAGKLKDYYESRR